MLFWNRIPAKNTERLFFMKKILVIGAGASGMMAAITAAKNGGLVTIYEKSDRVGKKILATGNGKCNLTNLSMGTEYYYTDNPNKLEKCLVSFGAKDTINFFKEHGLMLRERDGYVYPYCEQASVVLDVLRGTLDTMQVKVCTCVTDIRIQADKQEHFLVTSSLGTERFDAVILACGSKAGIKNADTSGYDYAKAFGHRINKLYPALVQVRCRESFFSMIAGVRCKAGITLLADKKVIAAEQGELQLTDYGISGIPVFQLSRLIAGYLDEKKELSVLIDFIPHLSMTEWTSFYEERMKQYFGRPIEDFLLGMLHKKISLMLLKEYGLKSSDRIDQKTVKTVAGLCKAMKEFTVTPGSVNPFEQAQVCRGGVSFGELNEQMQSIYQNNLYICGEMVDIDGKCGGYNLQWAWTSGYIAGISASKR